MENSTQRNTQDTQSDINPYFLRYLREKVVQITQEELASKMNVDTETVKHWETGRRQPSQKYLVLLERFFWHKNRFPVFRDATTSGSGLQCCVLWRYRCARAA